MDGDNEQAALTPARRCSVVLPEARSRLRATGAGMTGPADEFLRKATVVHVLFHGRQATDDENQRPRTVRWASSFFVLQFYLQ